MDGISPHFEQQMAHPFRADQWPIIQHYRDIALSDDGTGSDRMVNDCLALVHAGEKLDVLLELGALRRQLEDDLLLLVSHEHLMQAIADWRIDQEEQRRRDGGFVTSKFLAVPLEQWATSAWQCVSELNIVVLQAIEAVRNTAPDDVATDTPPPEYSPLAKVLFQYRNDFVTAIPTVADALRQGRGSITVATQRKADGALILHRIAQALKLSDDAKKRITIHFPNASQVASRQPHFLVYRSGYAE